MTQETGLMDRSLKWAQPSAFRSEYELRADEDLLGTLRFRSAWGSLAKAEAFGECWTFKRVGFFRTRVTIRVCDSDTDLAVFNNNTWSGGGTLEMPDGKRFLGNTNFWQTRFEFKTEAGEELVRFHTGGLIHLSAEVEILPAGAESPELPLLLMLGWYLIVMLQQDSAAEGGAAVIM